MVHHCTKCELVFENRGELENHLAVDHVADQNGATDARGPGEGVRETVEPGGAGSSGAPESVREPPPKPSEARRGWLGRLLGRGRD
jgi:hypothetical protein